MYTKKILKNGLTVLKVPIRGAKSVLVDVFVRVGSRHEQKKFGGISHFLEHLFFKGSRKYPTAADLSHALDAIGAEYNANTGKEHTQYYIKAAKKHLKFIFEVLTDVLTSPVMAPEEIEREKGVIVEEINMYRDTPIRHVGDILEETMWPEHPLGRNIAGTKQTVKKISRQDIMNYIAEHYHPRNMILAVAGNFNDKAFDYLVRKHWSKLSGKKPSSWQRVSEQQASPRFLLESKSTEQYHLRFGFRAYHHDHPDFVPEIVLATILGGGMSSRLFTEIRERRGWAYYVRAEADQYRDTGNFMVAAGVRRDVLPDVVRTVVSELVKIKKEQVSERELGKAKEYLKGTLTLALEDSENMLGWYLEQTAFRKRVLEPEHAFELVQEVNRRDVQKAARDIFQNRKMSLAVIGPRQYGNKIQNLLRLD